MGRLDFAEAIVVEVLDEAPEHQEALSLYAKLKHMRRQLSLAVACAAQLQARRHHSGEQARMHLESMLHLAQDPTHGAGEFLAMGQFQLVQKPTAYLALEEAFRLFVSRRPSEASATCRSVADRYRERDAGVYKLAVLAEAWICELTGSLDAACEILEQLGTTRGFETDLDRLIALVGLYEKAGTRERLEAAVKICTYLEGQFEESTTLGRLALLHRRLGAPEAAAEYGERHRAAYRRAMHRPEFAEVVAVASRRFLPIESMQEIRFPRWDLPANASAREIAIAAAIRGDIRDAKEFFSRSTDLLDLKYRANLEALEGTAGQALELFARALEEDPRDLHVIGWLLDRGEEIASGEVADLLRNKSIVGPVLETLETAAHAAPNDHRLWKRLAVFFQLENLNPAQQHRFAERAAALERGASERSRAIGRGLAAAAYRFAGTTHGLIHEIWATREQAAPGHGGALRRDDILGNVTDEMRGNVRNTFLAAREYAQAKYFHATRDILDYDYAYKVTKEDEPSGGTSAGLPTALAFLSLFLRKPMPQDIASTGVVVTDAHDVLTVRMVGDIEYKVNGAYHRNLRMILVPLDNRPILEQSAIVPRDICNEIVRYVADVDEAVRLVFGDLESL
jgi:hypothetical protein